jgi:hypothetical protein
MDAKKEKIMLIKALKQRLLSLLMIHGLGIIIENFKIEFINYKRLSELCYGSSNRELEKIKRRRLNYDFVVQTINVSFDPSHCELTSNKRFAVSHHILSGFKSNNIKLEFC